jgi:hypothetical protein
MYAPFDRLGQKIQTGIIVLNTSLKVQIILIVFLLILLEDVIQKTQLTCEIQHTTTTLDNFI